MKKFRLYASMCATVFAASMAFAGGDECADKAAAGDKCCKGKEAAACCKTGGETAKADCAKEGCSKEGCAGAVAKGGAEDAAKGAAEGFGLGAKLPAITLPDAVTGTDAPLYDASANATVLIFWNQKCPYVVEAQDRVSAYAAEAKAKGVRVVAIDANDPGKANSDAELKEYASTRPFSILKNPDSTVAMKFGATRTPEAYVLDKNGVVVYHGAFDGGQKDPKKTYVADAVNAVLEGKTPEVTTTKAFGCTIKFSDSAKNAAKNEIREAMGERKAAMKEKVGDMKEARKEVRKDLKAKGEKKAEEAAAAAGQAPSNN